MEALGYDSIFKAELKFGLGSPFSSPGLSSFYLGEIVFL